MDYKESDFITKEFLENNLFEQDKVGAGGMFPWRYDGKHCYVVLVLSGVGSGIPSIYVENKDTNRSIDYSHVRHNVGDPHGLLKDELKRCMTFLGVNDEFDYEVDARKGESVFKLAVRFIEEAQHNSNYVDVNSAGIYTSQFIEDFAKAVAEGACERDKDGVIERMVRILKEKQFDFDYIDEDGNLYNDMFVKHFKRRYVLLEKDDIVKRLSGYEEEAE